MTSEESLGKFFKEWISNANVIDHDTELHEYGIERERATVVEILERIKKDIEKLKDTLTKEK
jgi:hypothetical protein